VSPIVKVHIGDGPDDMVLGPPLFITLRVRVFAPRVYLCSSAGHLLECH